jgi:methionyl aminopeptidase
MPSEDDVLADGDIVNFDITLEKDGFIADSSKTYMIGNVAPHARRLVQTTYDAMWQGIRAVRPGARLGDIGHAIERHAKRRAIRSCAIIAAMASGAKCTKTRRFCISANPARA